MISEMLKWTDLSALPCWLGGWLNGICWHSPGDLGTASTCTPPRPSVRRCGSSRGVKGLLAMLVVRWCVIVWSILVV